MIDPCSYPEPEMKKGNETKANFFCCTSIMLLSLFQIISFHEFIQKFEVSNIFNKYFPFHTFTLWQSALPMLPIIFTRTRTFSKMMKTNCISKNYFSLLYFRYKLHYTVTITAYSQILHYSHWC